VGEKKWTREKRESLATDANFWLHAQLVPFPLISFASQQEEESKKYQAQSCLSYACGRSVICQIAAVLHSALIW